MENVRKHRDIKLVTTDTRRNQVVSERLQYNNIFFSRLISKKNEKDFYKDIADEVKKRYDTSNYGVDRPLPNRMNKMVHFNER